MKVLFACVADNAQVDTLGKLNVNGIFDRLTVAGFPARSPQIFLVFRLLFEFGDNQKTNTIQIVLRDQDSTVAFSANGEIRHPDVQPGGFVAANQIVRLVDLQFQSEGRYEFVLTADGGPEFVVPLVVTTPP